MSFLSSIQGTVLQGYAALQGVQGQTQSANDTLTKLIDRLQNAVQHEDRRSSLLGIKGMARDWKHVWFGLPFFKALVLIADV